MSDSKIPYARMLTTDAVAFTAMTANMKCSQFLCMQFMQMYYYHTYWHSMQELDIVGQLSYGTTLCLTVTVEYWIFIFDGDEPT